MKVQKDCSTCQWDFGGFCTAGVGEKTLPCGGWKTSPEYLEKLVLEGPWYLAEGYSAGKLNEETFLLQLEQDDRGEAVDMDLYTAIEHIYGFSTKRLAEVMGVSTDVVRYAKAHGTVEKRISRFSHCLCIPEKFFRRFTTKDLPLLEQCRERYICSNEKPEQLD